MVCMADIEILIDSISGEKQTGKNIQKFEKVQISTDVNISQFELRGDSLIGQFQVQLNYNPSIGGINLQGQIIIQNGKTDLEKIKQKYEENKKPPQKIVQELIKQSLIEATQISKTLNLPPPFPLPQIQTGENPEKELI